jgi:HEAT repeat protein
MDCGLDPLIQELRNPADWARAEAARRLGDLGIEARAATSALIRLLEDTTPVVRDAATQALKRIAAAEAAARVSPVDRGLSGLALGILSVVYLIVVLAIVGIHLLALLLGIPMPR